MDQLRKLLASLTARQKISIGMAVLMAGAALSALLDWKRETDFRPLYTGMAPEDAGAVVQKLKAGGLDYRLSDSGTSVLVPSARLAEVRLEMAAAGLPKSGRMGFELFDKTNFGATEFVEQINYKRALEGELERSVMALSEVEQARVHITFSKDSVFLESRQPAKASIMLRLRPAARIAPQNVQAVCHLVASAVEGLSPDAVSVLDMNGNLLSRPRRLSQAAGMEPSDDMLEFREKVEKDLVAKIGATLEPLLGPEKFRAGASVECDFTSGEQAEETFDPAKSVMVTSQKTEDVSGAGSANGVPGTASNLPRPTSRPATSQAGLSRRTENITYQSSRVTRRTVLPRGAVKRMSISVLVDHTVRWEGEGATRRRVLSPPPAETVKSIRDLVAGVTGLRTDRGDQLIVEALPFESTLNLEPPPAAPAPGRPGSSSKWQQMIDQFLENRNLVILVALGVAALLFLGRGLMALLTRGKRPAELTGPPALPAAPPSAAEIRAAAMLPALESGPRTENAELLAERIRESVRKDAAVPAGVVRNWLRDNEE
jgi:flagellar M-ring protein FliF